MTDQDGQPLGQALNEQFGLLIRDKALVEDGLRRAQLAILNPDKPASQYLDGSYEDPGFGSKLTFSQNCITLQINGPNVADLSFCDLPGIFSRRYSHPRYEADML
jgi:hypothetical protein